MAAAVVVVLAGSVVGYAEYLNHEIRRIGVAHLKASASSGLERNTENILLVGSTSRCALAHQNAAFGLCDQGVTGVNSDVVMILHLDPDHRRVAILSIPRDLFVPNARTTGANKIDAALAQGPSQLVDVIEEDFGIPIQHYAELNFDSFQGIVDALGGLRMYFPMPLYDAYSSLDVTTAGCHTLNGFQALAVVRARHLQYKPPGVTTTSHAYWPQDPESDLSRIRRDHEFIRVLASAVASRGVGNPITDQALVSATAPQLQVDRGLSLTDMVNLVLTYHSVDPATAPQLTLPVRLHGGLDFYYEGFDYGSIEFPSAPEDHQIIDQFLGLPSNVDTMTGAMLPAPGSFTVAVTSGTGVASSATAVAALLRAQGYDVVSTSSSVPHSSPAETLVTYQAGSARGEAAAEQLARSLSGPVVLAAGGMGGTGGAGGFGGSGTSADVTLTVGDGVTVVVPSATSGNATGPAPTTSTTAITTTTAVSGTTSSTSSTSSSSRRPGSGASSPVTTTTVSPPAPSLEAPTSPSEPLAAFDPRSCTAGGAEGP